MEKEEMVSKKGAMAQLKNMITRTVLLHYSLRKPFWMNWEKKKENLSSGKPSSVTGISWENRPSKEPPRRGFPIRAKTFTMTYIPSVSITVKRWK